MPHPKMRESIMTSPENTALAVKLVPSIEITAAMVSDLRPDLAAVAKAYAQAALDPYIVTVRPAVALALQSKDDSAALEIDRLKGEIDRVDDLRIRQVNEAQTKAQDIYICATTENDCLKQEVKRLRAALEPFAGISGGLAGSIIGKMARHSISVLNTPDYPEASAEVELTKQIMDAVPKARAALLTEGGNNG